MKFTLIMVFMLAFCGTGHAWNEAMSGRDTPARARPAISKDVAEQLAMVHGDIKALDEKDYVWVREARDV